MSAMWWTMLFTVVCGIPFLLWWWRDADRWLKAEHRRFKPQRPPPRDGTTYVIVRDTPVRPTPQQ